VGSIITVSPVSCFPFLLFSILPSSSAGYEVDLGVDTSSFTHEGSAWYRTDTVGLLTCLDGYMNVALEQTEEYANGRLTGRFGECFLRGNNGMSSWYPSSRLHRFKGLGVGGSMV
jgi:hypothetical protein